MRITLSLVGIVLTNLLLIASAHATSPSCIKQEAQKAHAAIRQRLLDGICSQEHMDSHLSMLNWTKQNLRDFRSSLHVRNVFLDPLEAWTTIVNYEQQGRFYGNPYCSAISYHETLLGDVGNDCLYIGAYDRAALHYLQQVAVQEAIAQIANDADAGPKIKTFSAVQKALAEIANGFSRKPEIRSVHTNEECLQLYRSIKRMPLTKEYLFIKTEAANTLVSLALANDLAGKSLQADQLYQEILHDTQIDHVRSFVLQFPSFEDYLKILLAKIEPDIVRKNPRMAARLELVAEYYASETRFPDAIYWYKNALAIRQQSRAPNHLQSLILDKKRLSELEQTAKQIFLHHKNAADSNEVFQLNQSCL